ncbi:MAG: GNAT family N-acetyltransferase [Bacteroidales bacterium]|nr:GNAT family N-acetyltransferase [Bacteroidales bacterium]
MIRFYRHEEIDRTRWDACVEASPAATLFASFDFLSVANPEWAALVEDDYTAVMPLPWRSKFGMKYVYNPFYFSRLGIFSAEAVTCKKVAEFLQAVPKSFVSIDMNLNESVPDEASVPNGHLKVSHRLDLNQPYEVICKGYGSNHKRNIKAARAFGLVINESIYAEDVITLYRGSRRGSGKNVRMQDGDYDIFLEVCELARQRGLTDVWGVRDSDGILLAGAVFLRDYDRVWFWASGREEERADRKAMFFLMDEYIRQHAQQPLVLDFNGSSTESVARFYAGFGSQRYTFPALSVLCNSWAKPLLHLYRKIK